MVTPFPSLLSKGGFRPLRNSRGDSASPRLHFRDVFQSLIDYWMKAISVLLILYSFKHYSILVCVLASCAFC